MRSAEFFREELENPLIRACICEEFASVQLLLMWGFRISDDFVEVGETEESRLKRFRALCSPSYITLTSVDNVLCSLTLGKRFREMAGTEPEFTREYLDLSNGCEAYAVDLLDACRTEAEEDSMLRGKDLNPSVRFYRAILNKQKAFVTNPKAVKEMRKFWDPEGGKERTRLDGITIFEILLNLLLFPLISLYLCLVSERRHRLFVSRHRLQRRLGRLGRLTRLFSPRAMALRDFCALFYYLALYLSIMVTFADELLATMVVFVFGQIVLVAEKIVAMKGGFVKDAWNVYGAFHTVVMAIASILFVSESRGSTTDSNSTFDFRFDSFHRFFWTVGFVLAYARIFHVFQILSKFLGTMQIMMLQMVYQIFSVYIIIYATTVLCFGTSLCLYLTPYSWHVVEGANGYECEESAFVNLKQSYKTLFWDIFGLGDKNDATKLFPNVPLAPYCECLGCNDTFFPVPEMNRLKSFFCDEKMLNDPILIHAPSLRCNSTFTAADVLANARFERNIRADLSTVHIFSYVLLAVYHIIAIVLLLNMLIAMMNQSFSEIHARADTEWKYSLALFYVNFIVARPLLPTPFNLLLLLKSLVQRCCGPKTTTDENLNQTDADAVSINNSDAMGLEKTDDVGDEYQRDPELQEILHQRIISVKNNSLETVLLNTNELLQEVSDIRHLLLKGSHPDALMK